MTRFEISRGGYGVGWHPQIVGMTYLDDLLSREPWREALMWLIETKAPFGLDVAVKSLDSGHTLAVAYLIIEDDVTANKMKEKFDTIRLDKPEEVEDPKLVYSVIDPTSVLA